MTIRILACSGSLESGGSERQLWQLVTRLPRDEFQPLVYLLYRRGAYLQRLPPGTEVYDFASNYRSRLWWPGKIHRAQVRHLAGVLQRAGIDVVYDRTYHMTLVTGAACRWAGIPRISVITSPPSRDLGSSQERFRAWKRWLLARHYADPCAVTVAVSQSVADDAARYYRIPITCIHVLSNAVDVPAVETLASQPLEAAEQMQLAAGSFWLVVGRMTPEKNHALAIAAFARYSARSPSGANSKLVLIGEGPQREQLQALTRRLNLGSQVQFLGRLDNPFTWMRAARGLIIPSRYEGMPNVALEAMTLGCPVIAARCSGDVESLLADGRGDLVPIDDPESLAAAMERHDRKEASLAQRQREEARRYVTEHFGLSRWLDQMQDLIRRQAEQRLGASCPRSGGER